MVTISLLTLVIQSRVCTNLFTLNTNNRILFIILIYSFILNFNIYYDNDTLNNGITIYSNIFKINNIIIIFEMLIYLIGCIIIIAFPIIFNNNNNNNNNKININININYCIIVLFSVLGQSFICGANDIISIYLSLELISFGIYIISTISNSIESTNSGLKYFLLGSLSSALILLGSALIYSYSGQTNFNNLYDIINVISIDIYNIIYNINSISIGVILIGIGLLFKITAAPFHNWAPDIYSGTPTIVTIWLTIIPKISIIIFIIQFQSGITGAYESISIIINNNQSINIWQYILLISSILSIIIGSIVGINQIKIKRLLAYSTINHIGFILLCLAINTESSISANLFYIIQYSITNICVFIIILYISYEINNNNYNFNYNNIDINYIDEFKGLFIKYPLLSYSLSICIFSIAGIPPLIGFFSKQIVLYSSIQSGYNFITIIAIICSIISASYYLNIIKVIWFNNYTNINTNTNTNININTNTNTNSDTSSSSSSIINNNINNINNNQFIINDIHSYIIAIIIIIINFYIIQPQILLNCINLLILTIYTT